MKRDKLDELLKSKLDKIEVRPPDDMWARLEAQLPEIRRGLVFGGEGTPAPDESLPAPKIRRPLRRKMRWAYVAASVAAVAMMVFSLSRLEEEAPVLAGGPEDIPGTVVLPAGHNGTSVMPDDTQINTPAVTGRVRRTAAVAITEPDGGHTSEPEESIFPAGVPSQTPGTDNNTTPRTFAGDNQPSAGDRGGVQNNTSDKRTWDGTAAGSLEEWERNRRRSAPRVSASLFAMNAAGTNNTNGNVTSRTKLQNSNLVVNETGNYPDDEDAVTRASGSGSKANSSSSKLKHDLPLSFGASVNINIWNNLSIETGLTYTYMRSKSETTFGTGGASSTVVQKLHYLGIPVKLKYDFFHTRVVDLYVSGGGSLEKLLSGKQTQTNRSSNGDVSDTSLSTKLSTNSLQGSVGANVGVSFNLDRRFGLYIEPGIGYYFENSNQPESYRTENPFNFTIKAGLRIKL